MVVAELSGGLGNQMFQYAYARWLALRREDPLLFLDCRGVAKHEGAVFANGTAHRPYELHRFNLPVRIWDDRNDWRFRGHSLPSRLICRLRRLLGNTRFVEDSLDSPQLSDAAGSTADLYCQGLWHHHLYSSDPELRARLCADFDFGSIINARATEIANLLQDSPVPCVSFHVRRGDYLTAAGAAVQGLCSARYYQQARELLEQRHGALRYVVFSDDIDWCRQELRMPQGTLFVSGDPQLDAHQEMFLMTRCRHHVLANSTFSWWGWILRTQADGDCIAPMPWYADRVLERQMAPRLPPQWLRLRDAP